MTITIDLPEELASQLTALLPEKERDRFAIAAIAEALSARLQACDARLAASLVAEIDPEKEPEREAAECIVVVEEGLEDVDAGRNLVSLEEVRLQWEAEKTVRRTTDRR
jgi:predicted transcriptional regulator